VARVIFNRIFLAILVVWAVVSLVFLLIHLSGDPLDALVPPGSSPADRAVLAQKYRLDEPLARQYVGFISDAIQGDFGVSWRSNRPATEVVFDRLPSTLVLVSAAFALAVLVSLPIGIMAGAHPGRIADWISSLLSIGGQGIPAFWLGTMFILIFAVRLGWLPSSGGGSAAAYVLPVLTLAAYPAGVMSRLVRSSVGDELNYDYVRTARSKGLDERVVFLRHILRNALGPFIAYAGVMTGFLIGSAVVVEEVFALPGAGALALQSVGTRDLPVVIAFVATVAVIIVASNLLADSLAIALDPRLRPAERAGGGMFA
jgi:peptide/nickel transport system permease protein